MKDIKYTHAITDRYKSSLDYELERQDYIANTPDFVKEVTEKIRTLHWSQGRIGKMSTEKYEELWEWYENFPEYFRTELTYAEQIRWHMYAEDFPKSVFGMLINTIDE